MTPIAVSITRRATAAPRRPAADGLVQIASGVIMEKREP